MTDRESRQRTEKESRQMTEKESRQKTDKESRQMTDKESRQMTDKESRQRTVRKWKITIASAAALAAIIIASVCALLLLPRKEGGPPKPDALILAYMACISEKDYAKMYQMLDVEGSGSISQEDFIKRNSAIYEGIETRNMEVSVIFYDEERNIVQYQTSFDTVAGKVSFENKAFFLKKEEGYRLAWDDSLIYPKLRPTDRVRVSTTLASRGEILDRDGRMLAGAQTASSVGIVPGKLQDREGAVRQIADLLGMQPEEIERRLSANWVKDDSFVPLKTLKKIQELDLLSIQPDEGILKEQERQRQLQQIPGVKISDTEERAYPLGEAAAHLLGYVQNVTAEDLEEHEGEGYTSDSVIGKSGAEALFEKELKGQNGCRLYIVDAEGNEKEELASRQVEHGKNVTLTIDSQLQRALYQQFKEDKGCSVAMDPKTGEVLALVSTPSYDSNDFITGLSEEKWASLNGDERKPLFNRFRQTWCPGSALKPVVAAIGIDAGAIDPQEDYGNVGLSWQKDASWGAYYVTTLKSYSPVILENALKYSDNIYFAKAALNIGSDRMREMLLKLGFSQELPFEISMSPSQFSNTEGFESEVQLADTGYGQGQVLANPLHLASIYTAFCNQGNVVRPYLVKRADASPEYWIANAFSPESVQQTLVGLKKVVNDPDGTGYGARREDVLLAGKTGTAETKGSKEDGSGAEIGWFAVFTVEESAKRPILVVSMVENVDERERGYVAGKVGEALQGWFGG